MEGTSKGTRHQLLLPTLYNSKWRAGKLDQGGGSHGLNIYHVPDASLAGLLLPRPSGILEFYTEALREVQLLAQGHQLKGGRAMCGIWAIQEGSWEGFEETGLPAKSGPHLFSPCGWEMMSHPVPQRPGV